MKEKTMKESDVSLHVPVICSDCGAENSIRWDHYTVVINDKKRSIKNLNFHFCQECGDITNVDFS